MYYLNLSINRDFFVFTGVYDQDAHEELLLTHPYLYGKGRLGLVYQPYSFWLTILDAVYQSLVIFYFAFWVSFPFFFICQHYTRRIVGGRVVKMLAYRPSNLGSSPVFSKNFWN